MAAAAWLPVLIVVVTPRFRLKPSSDQGTCGKWTIPLLDQGPSSFTWRSPKPIEFGDRSGTFASIRCNQVVPTVTTDQGSRQQGGEGDVLFTGS